MRLAFGAEPRFAALATLGGIKDEMPRFAMKDMIGYSINHREIQSLGPFCLII